MYRFCFVSGHGFSRAGVAPIRCGLQPLGRVVTGAKALDFARLFGTTEGRALTHIVAKAEFSAASEVMPHDVG